MKKRKKKYIEEYIWEEKKRRKKRQEEENKNRDAHIGISSLVQGAGLRSWMGPLLFWVPRRVLII